METKKVQIYKGALNGDLSPAETQKILQSEALTEDEDIEVFVTPKIVKGVLGRYLANEIDAQQLSDWAKFLILNDVYVTPGWENDDQSDKYEPMWNILQQLSSPYIDGKITKNRVKTHVEVLLDIAKR